MLIKACRSFQTNLYVEDFREALSNEYTAERRQFLIGSLSVVWNKTQNA